MSEFDSILTPDVRFHLVHKMERHKVIALAGPRLLPHEEKYLHLHNVAGVILFSRNVQSLSQVADLVASVDEYLSVDDAPALVMADHEGDMVAQLRGIIGVPPSALAIAATGDVDLAREVARETGAVMRKLGVNVVLAPVADLYIDPASPITGLRAFGRDPERVASFVAASVEGFRAAGIASCAKHFPGHGDTAEDSHETLPEIRRSLKDLNARDLIPFRRAVEAGVEMMMMSHIAFPLDREELVPASFDSRMIAGVLRETLDFDGVVITDSLEMAPARWYAQSGFGGLAGGFERALLAGSDLLLHTKPIPEQVKIEGAASPVMSINVMDTIIKTLEKVVDRGRIDKKLAEAATGNDALRSILNILGTSGDRILQLRRSLAGTTSPRPSTGGGNVIQLGAFPTVPSVYREVAGRAVIAPHGWDEVATSSLSDRSTVVMPIQWSPGESINKQDLDEFLDVMLRHFPDWERTGCAIGFSGDGEDVEPVMEPSGRRTVVDASRYDASASGGGIELGPDDGFVVVFSTRGIPDEAFGAALERFVEIHRPDVIVVTGWPQYDWIPEGIPVLLTLGASPQNASALAEVLQGHTSPAGSLEGLLPEPRKP